MTEFLLKLLFVLGLFILAVVAGIVIGLFTVIGIPFLLITLTLNLVKWAIESINNTLIWLRNYFFY